MSNIKLRLKHGSREIEIEGEADQVDGLLEKWWPIGTAPSNDEEDNEDQPEQKIGSPNGKAKVGKKRPRRSSTPTGEGTAQPAHDANKFANDVKQDSKFARIKDKIILGSPSLWDRIAFVFWYANEPLTSGDVKRSLEALGIKMDTPRVSRAIAENSGRLILSAQRVKGAVVRYTMTTAARDEFEKWFNADT